MPYFAHLRIGIFFTFLDAKDQSYIKKHDTYSIIRRDFLFYLLYSPEKLGGQLRIITKTTYVKAFLLTTNNIICPSFQ